MKLEKKMGIRVLLLACFLIATMVIIAACGKKDAAATTAAPTVTFYGAGA